MKGQLFKGQRHSTNQISYLLGVSKSSLYRTIKDEKRIKCLNIDILREIARLEGLEPEELRGKMLEYAKESREKEWNTEKEEEKKV